MNLKQIQLILYIKRLKRVIIEGKDFLKNILISMIKILVILSQQFWI
jgi:hypothetical protein